MHHPVDNELDESLERAAGFLQQAGCVAVLTGAGVSAESGLATFRDAGGLWEGHAVEEVATPEAFAINPSLVWKFYNARRANLRSARPNPGHLALAALEQRFGSECFALATQNVDGLHRIAGSQRLFELHGNLNRVRCTGCGQTTDRAGVTLDELPHCPDCGALLRPDVVWFGEALPPRVWREAEAAVRACDCFLVVGTSAIVYPAAGLIELARSRGARVIEANLTATPASRLADACLLGRSGVTLPRLLEQLAGLRGGRGR
jgi:NAD-dependent deacetylase